MGRLEARARSQKVSRVRRGVSGRIVRQHSRPGRRSFELMTRFTRRTLWSQAAGCIAAATGEAFAYVYLARLHAMANQGRHDHE